MGHHASAAPRLDPGILAGFVDGTLAQRERRKVLAVLATSAPDRDVLADLIRMTGDEDGPHESDRPSEREPG